MKKTKSCETCKHRLLSLNIFVGRKAEFRCNNLLSDRFEGVVQENDSCSKWKEKDRKEK